MRKNKVNDSKYESLKCLECERCIGITEHKTPGFNMWQNTGKLYVITCDDGLTRDCEVGQDRPTNCLKFEELNI